MPNQKPPEQFQNPLPGDENFQICLLRQVNRKVPLAVANEICVTLSTALGANGLKEASDMVLVPAVFTAEGVHNGLFKPWQEISNAAPTLVGAPFFVNQPGEHKNGVTPPVDDEMTHHGLVLTVNKDEKRKRLNGIIGLFTPEYMQAKGYTPQRVRFQRVLVNSVKRGARFAISVSYLARVLRRLGQHLGQSFGFQEAGHKFNGVSIVPQGAEPVALMNGESDEFTVDILDGGFNAEPEEDALANRDDSIESLNMPNVQSGSKAMDAEQIRNMSVARLAEMNPDVANLANEAKGLRGDLKTAEKHSADLQKQVDALTHDAEKTGEMLANILTPDDAEKTLANADSNHELAEQVQEKFEELSNDLKERKQKDDESLRERAKKARKALANRLDEKTIKSLEDPANLPATVERLENLSNKLGTRRIHPSDEIVDGLEADFSNAEEFDDEEGTEDDGEDEEQHANAEYQALSNVFDEQPKTVTVKAGRGKAKKTTGGDA